MSTIRLGTAANVRDFQSLLDALSTTENHVLDIEALQDEFGRLRVWSGNLGALQKGHSSLDYRLRDAPLLSNEVSKLLKELEENLHAASDIISGVRLPYEEQNKLDGHDQDENSDDDDDDNDKDDFFSEDEDEEDSDEQVPITELDMRFKEIVDIVDNLYKISVRIRAPTVRTRSLKAASYQPKDPETGIFLFDQYAIYDIQHTQELVRQLRMAHDPSSGALATDDALTLRLARAVTLRRRQFRYWRRHREKLGVSTVAEEPQIPNQIERPEGPQRHNTTLAQAVENLHGAQLKPTHSQRTGRTLLSGTEATHHQQSLDEIVDSKSVTSYAVTVKDISGRGIEIPPPPKTATGDKDFECPYCFTICPARYGGGRPWKTHVLQDLQPYLCTYPDCQVPDQLFRSRREWVEHENSHRKAWRCPEHPDAVFRSEARLEEHLRTSHGDSISENQLPSIIKVGETSTIDTRQKCPICYIAADKEGVGALQNHIANHLERVAVFSLPMDTEDDVDGGSSQASRGRTDSADLTTSRVSSDSNYSQSSISDEEEEDIGSSQESFVRTAAAAEDRSQRAATGGGGLLSESLVHSLPDASGERLNILLSGQVPDDEGSVKGGDDILEADLEEHMAEREKFRLYLLSLPGAQSVRFYRSFGSWNGNVSFKDADFASTGMEVFDKERYPTARLRQKLARRETLKFSVLRQDRQRQQQQRQKWLDQQRESEKQQQAKTVSFNTEADVTNTGSPSMSSDARSVDSPPRGANEEHLSPILTVKDIPNLRAMYRSKELNQLGDGYVPHDGYNQIVSLCYYDITRLEVDAIVNSSNVALKRSKADWSLTNLIHKAAGPGLAQECSTIGTLRTSQAVLTSGHLLPCAHIIHVARPRHAGGRGLGQYNVLSDAYRNILKLAMNQNLKTIAICCIGTGGVGFPVRMAARIAAQETREFLDSRPENGFERIIFCVYTDQDHAAYTESLPTFFPPTHEDLELANLGKLRLSHNFDKFTNLTQGVYKEALNVKRQFLVFGAEATNSSQRTIQEILHIAGTLESFKPLVFHSDERSERLLFRNMANIELICSVVLAICGNMTEISEVAKSAVDLGQSTFENVWIDYEAHIRNVYNLSIGQLIDLCKEYAFHQKLVLETDAEIPHEMSTIGLRLGAWLTMQTGQGTQSIREHFEEALLTREYRQAAPTPPERNDVIRIHQIPTLDHLYKNGDLEQRYTVAVPSYRFNHMVCFAREDITNLAVDIIVNSTDTGFSGMGRLDRTVFRRGGLDLQEECENIGHCEEGDVKLTGGYFLPAKHVLHAIPPMIWRSSNEDVLHRMYGDILRMASVLKATSIAIPALGTGMLDYPRKESAAIAITEVKRFLEALPLDSPLEKIIFVVFSSNDDFVYKSLLPVYFPPLELQGKKPPHPESATSQSSVPASASELGKPGKLGKLGGLFRKMGSSRRIFSVSPSSTPTVGNKAADEHRTEPNGRSLTSSEQDTIIRFESHAMGCYICSNIPRVYKAGENLCGDGYRRAATVTKDFSMSSDWSIYSLSNGRTERVRIPEYFSKTLDLLTTVELSSRDGSRGRPFVSPNHPWPGLVRAKTGGELPPPSVTLHFIDVTIVTSDEVRRNFQELHVWSNTSDWPDDFGLSKPSLHISRGRLVLCARFPRTANISVFSLDLTPRSAISIHSTTEILVENGHKDYAGSLDSRYIIGCKTQTDRDMLLPRLKHAASDFRGNYRPNDTKFEESGASNGSETTTPHITTKILEERSQYNKDKLEISSRESGDDQSIHHEFPVVPAHEPSSSDAKDDTLKMVVALEESVEEQVGKSDAGFPGFLEHRLLSYVESSPGKAFSDEELAVELNESPGRIMEAAENLGSRSLIQAVPSSARMWRSVDKSSGSLDEGIGHAPDPARLDFSYIQTRIEDYFEHTLPPPSSMISSPDEIFEDQDDSEDSKAAPQRRVSKRYTLPYTKIDKRLIDADVLRVAGEEFSEKERAFHVFRVVGKDEVLAFAQMSARLKER